MTNLKLFRSSFLDFIADPFYESEENSVRYIPDGLLVVEAGIIKDFDHYNTLKEKYQGFTITHYPDLLIMPGFIDTHIHFPQTEMIASYGKQLLDWLNQYTFPTERKFSSREYAQKIAAFFLDELLKNGTTTALVFATVFPQSVEAFFEEAYQRNLRMISGKVMMDRHAPDYLQDTPETSYQETKQLIQNWHKKGRLLYAITPRFAITSSPEQLKLAGKLLTEFPDVYLQTHLSENIQEVEFVAELFPEAQHYLDVYDQAGLVGDRSIFAHSIHLSDDEFKRLSEAKSAIAFCPTSNLFLGSGLFKLHQAKSKSYPINVGLGSDIGAGTSFSLLQTANEAYKVAQLQSQTLSAFQALFLATLGGAKALKLDHKIGNFAIGKEADFIVLDCNATPLMSLKNQQILSNQTQLEIAEKVFTLIILGDDRAIQATYIMGEMAYSKK
ncbi:guanine deaminase [Planktothrix mougeotii]|uniref:Guanine deaminase n=1 Tax=Planktothrix mougeotii LEGE 06226 TaxID=1828728 RepID=A0ABR9UJT5_9CYAN|nr:guanine deaminase [Planktothrix mougeotii]MBE9146712.1 guanine deaminase [Planktothrix mougeotii LEGE 06226]